MHATHGGGWTINHNSDWSGEAYLKVGGQPTVKIPGDVLLDIAKTIAAKDLERKLVGAIESAIDEWKGGEGK